MYMPLLNHMSFHLPVLKSTQNTCTTSRATLVYLEVHVLQPFSTYIYVYSTCRSLVIINEGPWTKRWYYYLLLEVD